VVEADRKGAIPHNQLPSLLIAFSHDTIETPEYHEAIKKWTTISRRALNCMKGQDVSIRAIRFLVEQGVKCMPLLTSSATQKRETPSLTGETEEYPPRIASAIVSGNIVTL
jgi:hypothetical protein